MQLPLTGGCLCGALRYDISETPQMAYTCHCTDCQHLTGSAFSLAITVPDSAFRLTKGEPRLLQKIAESGRTVTRWLCPECGCWLTSSPQPGTTPGEMIRRGSRRHAGRYVLAEADRAFLDAQQAALGRAARRGAGGA